MGSEEKIGEHRQILFLSCDNIGKVCLWLHKSPFEVFEESAPPGSQEALAAKQKLHTLAHTKN